MPNIDLICTECKNSFYFSERDQAFYAARGFQQPRRCYKCRQARKQANPVQDQPQSKPLKGRRFEDDNYDD